MRSSQGDEIGHLRAQAGAGRGHEGLCVLMLGLWAWGLLQRETVRLQKLIVMPTGKFSLNFGCAFHFFRLFPEEMRLLPRALCV